MDDALSSTPASKREDARVQVKALLSKVGPVAISIAAWLVITIVAAFLCILCKVIALQFNGGSADNRPPLEVLNSAKESFYASGDAGMLAIGLGAGVAAELLIRIKQRPVGCGVMLFAAFLAIVLTAILFPGALVGTEVAGNTSAVLDQTAGSNGRVEVQMLMVGALAFGVVAKIVTREAE